MADWRKLIGKKESVVLPYFGGARVRAKDRDVRLADRPEEPGWYRFEITGRTAKAMDHAEPELAGLPKVRGHLAYESLFAANAPPEYVSFMPDDEPALFSACTCFRWHSGELVFGEVDFETEAEDVLRRALEEGRGLEYDKGIAAPLRGAYAWALIRRASREKAIPCTAREMWPHAREIASNGHAAAVALLEKLDELRNGKRIIVGGAAIHVRKMIARATDAEATYENAAERAASAIEAAGGWVRATRRLAGRQQIEVHFSFGGERFVSLVDALTLQVVDAGICLVDHGDGHRADADLTLDSLPAAIREAMDLGVLVITRR